LSAMLWITSTLMPKPVYRTPLITVYDMCQGLGGSVSTGRDAELVDCLRQSQTCLVTPASLYNRLLTINVQVRKATIERVPVIADHSTA